MPISGLFNMFSTMANNSFNAAEANKNRRWQEAMYEKQFSDSQEMWKMQQEYNSPENQVARLKSAGINPYLALGNINTGSATSAPSAQAGSGAQANGTPANFAGLTEGVLNLLRNKDERRILKEQATNIAADSLSKRIDSITQHQKNLAEILGRLKGADKDAASAALSRSLRQTEDELRGFKKQEYVNNTFESVIRQVTQWTELQYIPLQKRLEFSDKIANIALTYARKELTLRQAEHELEKSIETFFSGRGKQVQAEILDRAKEFIINKHHTDQWHTNPFGALMEYLGSN